MPANTVSQRCIHKRVRKRTLRGAGNPAGQANLTDANRMGRVAEDRVQHRKQYNENKRKAARNERKKDSKRPGKCVDARKHNAGAHEAGPAHTCLRTSYVIAFSVDARGTTQRGALQRWILAFREKKKACTLSPLAIHTRIHTQVPFRTF